MQKNEIVNCIRNSDAVQKQSVNFTHSSKVVLSLESLAPIVHKNQRILTTELLARAYDASTQKIRQNFNNNKKNYVEGEDYYFLEGKELATFKNSVENFDAVDNRIRYLYLWTEQGALLHAKSLNTEKAWQVYKHLIAHYFRTQTTAIANTGFSADLQLVKQLCANNVALEQRIMQLESQLEAQQTNSVNPQLERLINLLEKQYQPTQPLQITQNMMEREDTSYINQLSDKKLLTTFEAASYIGICLSAMKNIMKHPDFTATVRIGFGIDVDILMESIATVLSKIAKYALENKEDFETRWSGAAYAPSAGTSTAKSRLQTASCANLKRVYPNCKIG